MGNNRDIFGPSATSRDNSLTRTARGNWKIRHFRCENTVVQFGVSKCLECDTGYELAPDGTFAFSSDSAEDMNYLRSGWLDGGRIEAFKRANKCVPKRVPNCVTFKAACRDAAPYEWKAQGHTSGMACAFYNKFPNNGGFPKTEAQAHGDSD